VLVASQAQPAGSGKKQAGLSGPAGYGHNWPAMLAKHNDRPRVHVER